MLDSEVEKDPLTAHLERKLKSEVVLGERLSKLLSSHAQFTRADTEPKTRESITVKIPG